MHDHLASEDYLDHVVTSSLRPLALGLGALYLLTILNRAMFWTGRQRELSVLFLAMTAGALAVVGYSVGRTRRTSRWGALHGVLLICFVSVGNTMHYVSGIEESQRYTNVLLLAVLGCGLLLLDRLWTLFAVGVLAVLWSTAQLAAAGELPLEQLPAVMATLIVSLGFFKIRRALFSKQFSYLEEERTHNKILRQTLAQAQDSRHSLSQRVNVRTEQTVLTLKELEGELQAQVELKELVKKLGPEDPLGRLASGVAHDFNNLLSVLTLNSEELLEDESFSEAEMESLQSIEGSVAEVQLMVNQLLAFSRKQSLSHQPKELQDLLGSFLDSLKGLVDEHIELSLEISDPQARLLADPAQLQQALLNLVLNSCEAMTAGGRLSITTETRGDWVALIVADSGTGIEPESLESTREPFFTTKGLHEGRGLGLSVVDGIVAQHGGTLQLESQPGEGTTATLLLPLLNESEVDPNTVLVVEQDEPTRLLAERYLRNAGYRVMAAPSVSLARQQFLKTKPHPGVLVLESSVSGPGESLAADLLGMSAALQLIIVSPEAGPAVAPEFKNWAHLRKPYSPRELLRLVSGDK